MRNKLPARVAATSRTAHYDGRGFRLTRCLQVLVPVPGLFTKSVNAERRGRGTVPLLQTWKPGAELRGTAAVKKFNPIGPRAIRQINLWRLLRSHWLTQQDVPVPRRLMRGFDGIKLLTLFLVLCKVNFQVVHS